MILFVRLAVFDRPVDDSRLIDSFGRPGVQIPGRAHRTRGRTLLRGYRKLEGASGTRKCKITVYYPSYSWY